MAGGLLLAGAGAGLRLKAGWIGRRERALDALLRVRVDWLDQRGGAPAGKAVRGLRGTGVAAGDATPAGPAAVPRRRSGGPAQTSSSLSIRFNWWRAIARLARPSSTR